MQSPIELFLIKGLANRDVFPVIQTLIFSDGQVFDNFYHMIENRVFVKGEELIRKQISLSLTKSLPSSATQGITEVKRIARRISR